MIAAGQVVKAVQEHIHCKPCVKNTIRVLVEKGELTSRTRICDSGELKISRHVIRERGWVSQGTDQTVAADPRKDFPIHLKERGIFRTSVDSRVLIVRGESRIARVSQD